MAAPRKPSPPPTDPDAPDITPDAQGDDAPPVAPARPAARSSRKCPSCEGPLKSLNRGKTWYCEEEGITVDVLGDGRPSNIGDRLDALEADMNPIRSIVKKITGKDLREVTDADVPELPAGLFDSLGSSVMSFFGGSPKKEG